MFDAAKADRTDRSSDISTANVVFNVTAPFERVNWSDRFGVGRDAV